MRCCPQYQETLMLDLHGELSVDQQTAWRRHLAGCLACRRERDGLKTMLLRVQDTLAAPDMSTMASQSLQTAIINKLEQQRRPVWRRLGRTSLVSALASVMLVLTVLGWWYNREDPVSLEAPQVSSLSVEEQLPPEDFEVIQNLELLKEMDSIQKLVQHVDPPDYGQRDGASGYARNALHGQGEKLYG